MRCAATPRRVASSVHARGEADRCGGERAHAEGAGGGRRAARAAARRQGRGRRQRGRGEGGGGKRAAPAGRRAYSTGRRRHGWRQRRRGRRRGGGAAGGELMTTTSRLPLATAGRAAQPPQPATCAEQRVHAGSARAVTTGVLTTGKVSRPARPSGRRAARSDAVQVGHHGGEAAPPGDVTVVKPPRCGTSRSLSGVGAAAHAEARSRSLSPSRFA